MNNFSIVHYEPRHQHAFKMLNLEWLEAYHLLEDRDMEALDHPECIVESGGVIYLAMDGDELIGSAAVIAEHGEFELAKMAVSKNHRGRGVSKPLLDRCLDFARSQGAKKIILYSNHQLTTALQLYRKYGFKDVALNGSPFATADVKMELVLQ